MKRKKVFQRLHGEIGKLLESLTEALLVNVENKPLSDDLMGEWIERSRAIEDAALMLCDLEKRLAHCLLNANGKPIKN